jgi:hypothetical protein
LNIGESASSATRASYRVNRPLFNRAGVHAPVALSLN